MDRCEVKYLQDLITKAEAWCCSFDDFAKCKVFDDRKIRILNYIGTGAHSKTGDLMVFQKGFCGLPKLVLVVDKVDNDWHLRYFRTGHWFNYLSHQIN